MEIKKNQQHTKGLNNSQLVNEMKDIKIIKIINSKLVWKKKSFISTFFSHPFAAVNDKILQLNFFYSLIDFYFYKLLPLLLGCFHVRANPR